MSFNSGADMLQRISGGRFNVPVADDDLRANSRMMAEYGLVEAVLREAIREYQKFAGQQGRRGSRLFREVHEWFLDDDRKWDFSFVNVCQILDLEPGYIRTGLQIWSDRNVSQDTAQESGKASTRRTHRRQANPRPMGTAIVPR
jgi:hypothetical protein